MDDGSAKCLLDVINDPNALQEFLRSNSQDNGIHPKNSTPGAVSGSDYGNHLSTPPLLNASGLRTSSVASGLTTNTRSASVGSGFGNIHSSAAPQNTLNAVVNNNSVARTSASSTASYNVGVVPSSVPVSSGVSFLKTGNVENALNKVGSAALGMSHTPGSIAVAKPVVTTAFQGKKPIPIQPKTPNASSALTSSTVGSPGNRGRQVINSGVPLAVQKQTVSGQQSISPVGHRVALNGIDSKANVKANVVTGSIHNTKSSPLGNTQPVLSATPVKRIAPKQPNILPQTGLSSPPQMVGAQHKILLQQVSNQVTPQVQTIVNQVSPGTVQQQNHTQLIQAQQLLNLIRGQNPPNQTTQQASPQLVQSQSLPANQIKQIQQLVQQKLSNQQQQQPQVVQTVQQKVLTPAQLQAALKQNQQLTTQTVQAAQPQNIVVQEEVIKQLLQQVTQQKAAQSLTQQQPQLFQQIQQPVQKQILVQNIQPQSAVQGQKVNISSQAKHSNLKQRTDVAAASPVNVQLQQVLNSQQKQVHQIIGQQQVNLLPQQNIVITKDPGARLLQGVTFVQNQPNKNSTAQVLNQGIVVQQAKPVVQQAKPSTTPIVQVATTTQQNTMPPTQQQQQAQNAGVQKVFIIKQPELLQKLGLQGTKTQQTIQITPQQLQALKQFQLQQQAVKQKLVSNNMQTGTNVQPKGLTTDQLKQFQLQQQLQGSAVKQVVVQSRTQQPTLQQQRQVNVKTQGKMQHIPRILQTSGRQPVSQSIKVSVPVKQETSKGVKRPHPSDATAEVPKVATRLKQGLTQDQQAVLRPDLKTPFTSHDDIVKRLTPYHVCYDPSPTPADVQKADNLFSAVSTQLVKRSQKMMEKHRQLLFDESMREHPSAEMVMLYRVFLTNERAALAEERKKAKENPMEILSVIKKENIHEETASSVTSTETSQEDLLSSKHKVTSTTDNDFIGSMKNTVSEASSKISSLLNINMSPPLKNSYTNTLSPKTEISSSSSPRSIRTHSSLAASSANNYLPNSSAQECPSKQATQLMDNAVENHSLGNADFDVSGDSSVDLPMDTETEKEDVTATLALLNSMASELDEVLDVEGTL